MFKVFFLREIKGALKSPMVYIFIFIYALLVFGAVSSDNVVIGGTVGNIKKNAPYVLTTFITTLSIFGLLFAAAFFNNAALRDYQNQFQEILFSTPMKKSGFFFGRFLGALFLATLPFLGIYVGAMLAAVIAPAVGWLDPDRIGPFEGSLVVNSFLIFVVPNMLLGGSIIFWLAHRFKNTVVSFVGAMGIIMAYLVTGTLISDVDNQTLAALTDPFGIRTYGVYTKYFTSLEKNTLVPAFEGLLLQNRLIWISVALIISALSYLSFSTKERKAFRKKKTSTKAEKSVSFSLPQLKPSFNLKSSWLQFASIYATATRSIIKSTVFRILFLFCAIILISSMIGGFEYFGLQSYPVTYKMMEMVSNNTAIFVMITVVFFSGELVWRERLYHIDEVVNTTPHSSFSGLVAKSLSLISAATLLHLFFVVVAMLYQLISGYTNLEPAVYLGGFVLEDLPIYVVYSLLFVFLQTIINNRYIGYFVSVLFLFVSDIILSALDIETNMLDFGGGPRLVYSDMNGFGNGLSGALWFNIYWLLFAVLLLAIAGLFLSRHTASSKKERWRRARRNLKGRYALGLTVLGAAWILTASFVYYNTQLLNPYSTSDETEVDRANYEKQYKKFESKPLPKITAVNYFIDIYPESRDIKSRAEMQLMNQSSSAIDSLYVSVDLDWETELSISNASLIFFDEELGFQIYVLDPPLAPQQSVKASFSADYITQGFENTAGSRTVNANGTFINNSSVLPGLGYNANFELLDKNDRKKYGLKPKKRLPELKEDCGNLCMVNSLSDGLSDWVEVETTISTSKDQLAIAPGSLQKRWEENGRNYFQYKVDHASQNFYSFMSADYQVAHRKWQGIDLEVYYDEKHSYNIEMMLDAIQSSLEYYTEHFGPYYHKQARIIEFPRYRSFAQAFPGTMPYSEAFGFIIDLEDTSQNNVIKAVIAHEMAHQYWAHQEIPAKMQGSTMLTESFSEYSALMVMREYKSDLEMKDFLKYNFDRYLRGRGAETIKELPLYTVENQGYIHYGKGSVILYALQDYIGEDSVNAALQSFLNEYRYKEPPYPSSHDFLAHLEPRVPDSLKYLIQDWFKEITLYDLRLKEVSAELNDAGKYETKMEISASKIKADTVGNEKVVGINDWVDVGLYADDDESELIMVKRIKMNQETFSLTLTTDDKPVKAAIDPKRLLIERVIDDNAKTIQF